LFVEAVYTLPPHSHPDFPYLSFVKRTTFPITTTMTPTIIKLLLLLLPYCSGYASQCVLPSSLDVSLTGTCDDTYNTTKASNVTLYTARNSHVSFIYHQDPFISASSVYLEIVDTDDFKFKVYVIGETKEPNRCDAKLRGSKRPNNI